MSTEQITKKASKTVSGHHPPAAFERRVDVMAFYGDGASVRPLARSSTIKDMKALLHNA